MIDPKMVLIQTLEQDKAYTVNELYESTEFNKNQIRNALRHLWKGGVLDRRRNGRSYEYTSLQCELDL